jgi:FAD/FMN-containing dehydrogenase
MKAPSGSRCTDVFKELKNPYYLGDEIGLTQTLGWVDGWTSQPSEYAVVARTNDDVVAAVNFARDNNLRLVVKGGGHSYQGTSNAADSLLIWTRKMKAITVHDAFVGVGCAGRQPPRPAVTIGAGAIWGQAAGKAKIFWASNLEETGQVLHGYQSAWIPSSLLQADRQQNLADARSRLPATGLSPCMSTRALRALLPR